MFGTHHVMGSNPDLASICITDGCHLVQLVCSTQGGAVEQELAPVSQVDQSALKDEVSRQLPSALQVCREHPCPDTLCRPSVVSEVRAVPAQHFNLPIIFHNLSLSFR